MFSVAWVKIASTLANLKNSHIRMCYQVNKSVCFMMHMSRKKITSEKSGRWRHWSPCVLWSRLQFNSFTISLILRPLNEHVNMYYTMHANKNFTRFDNCVRIHQEASISISIADLSWFAQRPIATTFQMIDSHSRTSFVFSRSFGWQITSFRAGAFNYQHKLAVEWRFVSIVTFF